MSKIIDKIQVLGLEENGQKNGYFAEVTFNLHERGFKMVEMGAFSEQEMDELKDLVEIIHKCMEVLPEDYEFVDGFKDWFDGNNSEHPQATYMIYLPKGYGQMAPFAKLEVFYYKNGEKHPCEITWKEI